MVSNSTTSKLSMRSGNGKKVAVRSGKSFRIVRGCRHGNYLRTAHLAENGWVRAGAFFAPMGAQSPLSQTFLISPHPDRGQIVTFSSRGRFRPTTTWALTVGPVA